jgi:hypothetical protein
MEATFFFIYGKTLMAAGGAQCQGIRAFCQDFFAIQNRLAI